MKIMSIEEFIQHQAVSGSLTMEDRQYLELRDVEKVLQMADETKKLAVEGEVEFDYSCSNGRFAKVTAWDVPMDDLNDGEKVKVIILKEN